MNYEENKHGFTVITVGKIPFKNVLKKFQTYLVEIFIEFEIISFVQFY